MDVCTIVDRQSTATAEVLLASLERTQPDRARHVLVVDDASTARFGDASISTLSDLDFGPAPWLSLSGTHPDLRAEVLAGPYLAHLLGAGVEAVAYVAASSLVLGPLDEVETALGEHDVVTIALLPDASRAHAPMSEGDAQTGRSADLGRRNRRLFALRAGAVADRLLSAWPVWDEPEPGPGGAFVASATQRYLDAFADSNETVATLPQRGLGFNGLNYDPRRIAEGPAIDGVPLTHLDLWRFGRARPRLLPSPGDEAIRVRDCPVVADLLVKHAAALTAAGALEDERRAPTHTRTAGGRELDREFRSFSRAALDAGVLSSAPTTAAGSEQLMIWLTEPAAGGADSGLMRLHELIWLAREDLRGAFPDINGPDGDAFVAWLWDHGAREYHLEPSEQPYGRAPTPVDREDDDLAWGVNVAGFFRSELGLGEAARLLVTGLDAAGIPALPVQGELVPPCRQEAEFTFSAPADAPYPINIVCMNGDAIEPFSEDAGAGFFEGRHTIALWWWELLDAFPEEWQPAFEHLDEIWVATQHLYDAIAPASPVPVIKIPLPVVVPGHGRHTREELGMPAEGFVFLFMFDYHSTSGRKNPIGLVKAFRRAFPEGHDAKLVLKCINADRMSDQHEDVLEAIGGDPDITVIDRYVSADEKNALVGACDCYVSLHRSEGFGLTPAEAMVLGKPVIATRFGGTLEFMDDENSFLVDHGWTEVGPDARPYPEGARWAEPDLDHAARLMRLVVEDEGEARRRGENARAHMAAHHSPAAAGAGMRERLRTIYDGMQAEGRGALRVSDLPPQDRRDLAERISSDPVPASGADAGRIKDPARRAVGKALAPWTNHHRRIQRELLASVEDVERALHAASAELDARRREEVAETLAAFRRVRAEAGEQASRIATLERRLADLEGETVQHLAEHRSLPWMSADRAFQEWSDDRLGLVQGFRRRDDASTEDGYRMFEDAFRGDAARVEELQRAYVDLLRDAGPVLDCGCGRGELLALLRDADVVASGVDGDAGMLQVARDRGLDVREGDAIAHLEGLDPGTLGAVTAIEVIEHLPEPVLRRFFAAALRALRPAGVLIVETVNPHVVHALKAFWLDPTHEHPLFPEVVLELCREAGFETGAVFHPTGTGDIERDRFREPAYAVVATAGAA